MEKYVGTGDLNFKVLLLDIEGTTTPITFVTKTLFPYVKYNLKSYLDIHWRTEQLQQVVENLRKQHEIDIETGMKDSPRIDCNTKVTKLEILNSVANNVLWQMSLNRKTTALKDLQGMIWESGYKSKEIEGDLFEDVESVLRIFHNSGIRIYIYSSGSIYAQKLLFGYSVKGNLLQMINGHFDTNIGSKQSKQSYDEIAKSIGVPANQILFLTDLEQEALAATQANFKVKVVLRPGNKSIDEHVLSKYETITTFWDLVKSKIS